MPLGDEDWGLCIERWLKVEECFDFAGAVSSFPTGGCRAVEASRILKQE